jgi:hypothetical protein
MLLGLVLVLSLWLIAALALRAGVQPGLVALAAVWGRVVPTLGLTQDRLLPGSLHWLIQLLHLAVGLTAIGLGRTARPPGAGPTAPGRPARGSRELTTASVA